MTIRPLEIFYGHFVYFMVIWYIFPRFGILDQEKYGNPGLDVLCGGLLLNVGEIKKMNAADDPIQRSRVTTPALLKFAT
jgi:hypothetical protein